MVTTDETMYSVGSVEYKRVQQCVTELLRDSIKVIIEEYSLSIFSNK